jgi:TRAP-type uncharacterized transport system substrate-binding protein
MIELEQVRKLLTENHLFLINMISKQTYGNIPQEHEIIEILNKALLHRYNEVKTPFMTKKIKEFLQENPIFVGAIVGGVGWYLVMKYVLGWLVK